MKLNHKQLHRLVTKLGTRGEISVSLCDQQFVTTIGALHYAVRAIGALHYAVKDFTGKTARGSDPSVHTAAYPAAYKAEILERMKEPAVNIAALARAYGITDRTLFRWQADTKVSTDIIT